METCSQYYPIMAEENDAFITILKLLTPYGWQFIKKDYNNIIMNKKFSELEEIHIHWDKNLNNNNNNNIHFSLPLKKSNYSFYKKFHSENTQHACLFLNNYVQYLSTI